MLKISLPVTGSHSTMLYFSVIWDQNRNPNINNRDHLVGRPSSDWLSWLPQCPAYMFIVLVYNVQLDIQLPHSHNLVVGSAIQYDAQSSSSDVADLINPTMRWPCHCAQPRFLGHLYLAFSHPSIALYYISLLPGFRLLSVYFLFRTSGKHSQAGSTR